MSTPISKPPEISIDGNVQGNLKATESVRLGAHSHVQGSILTRRIAIEDGARLRGKVEMIRANDSANPSITAPSEENLQIFRGSQGGCGCRLSKVTRASHELDGQNTAERGAAHQNIRRSPVPRAASAAPASPNSRISNGLKEFLWLITDAGQQGKILDLGAVFQSTVMFFIEKGFRLSTEDLLRSWKEFLLAEEENLRNAKVGDETAPRLARHARRKISRY